jgi:hypothetical protein
MYINGVPITESSPLMEKKDIATLPKNRVVSFEFDSNNSRAFEQAMVDIHTVDAANQLKGFLDSEAMTSGSSDFVHSDDLKIWRERMLRDLARVRSGMGVYQNDKLLRNAKKFSNAAATAGIGLVMAGVEQIPKQSISAIANTLVNSGRVPIAHVMTSDEFNNWIDNSGMPVANRSEESRFVIQKAAKQIEEKGLVDVLDYANFFKEEAMKVFLTAPDIIIARASFLSFYKKYLQDNGLSMDIKYNEPMNRDAAEYAQSMLDAQQNISSYIQGSAFFTGTTKDQRADMFYDLARKGLLNLANFAVNAKIRFYSDFRVLRSNWSSEQDRRESIRSILAFGAELTTYQIMASALRTFSRMISCWDDEDCSQDNKQLKKLVDKENYRRNVNDLKPMSEEEEIEFRREAAWDLQLQKEVRSFSTQMVKDFLSPMPNLDPITVELVNKGIDKYHYMMLDEDEVSKIVEFENKKRAKKRYEKLSDYEIDKIRQELVDENVWRLYGSNEEFDYRDILGGAGIFMKKVEEIGKLSEMSSGVFEEEGVGSKTNTKYLLPKDQDKATFTTYLDMGHLLALPADFGKISAKRKRYLESRGFTGPQLEEYKELFKKRMKSNATGDELMEQIRKNPDVVSDKEARLIRDDWKVTRRDGKWTLKN